MKERQIKFPINEWRELTDEEGDDAGDDESARVVSFCAGARHQAEGDELQHEGKRHEGLHGDEPGCNETKDSSCTPTETI